MFAVTIGHGNPIEQVNSQVSRKWAVIGKI